jgi:predicted dehydrogenase
MDALPADFRTIAAIELESGAMVSITAVSNSHFATRRLYNTFGASNGTITVTGFAFDTVIHIQGQEPQRFNEESLLSVSTPVGNFAEAILGKAELYSPGEHGAHVVDVVEAAYRSAETGQTVVL